VRYCNLQKNELIKGCFNSLTRTLINASASININLIILDDSSSEDLLTFLRTKCNQLPFTTEIIQLQEKGYNNSAYHQFLKCRDSKADLVYSIEDDFLHCPTAIEEMVESYQLFVSRLKREEIVLYPFDEPSEYNPPNRTDFVVHGSRRHWRTGIFTTNVMLTKPQVFKDNWELFETLALKYNGDYLNPRTEHYEESNTIWKIFYENKAIRFNPIPSLALHMQFEQQQDPFINWKQWWNDYGNE
jgi:hypothetical protein